MNLKGTPTEYASAEIRGASHVPPTGSRVKGGSRDSRRIHLVHRVGRRGLEGRWLAECDGVEFRGFLLSKSSEHETISLARSGAATCG